MSAPRWLQVKDALEPISEGPKAASRTAVRGRLYTRPNGWNEMSARWRSAPSRLSASFLDSNSRGCSNSDSGGIFSRGHRDPGSGQRTILCQGSVAMRRGPCDRRPTRAPSSTVLQDCAILDDQLGSRDVADDFRGGLNLDSLRRCDFALDLASTRRSNRRESATSPPRFRRL